MQDMQLPAEVVETDHHLETAAEKASDDLAKHRWHWTLDESNPNRVTPNAYARAVGRHHDTIANVARGYAEWLRGGSPAGGLGDAIERAKHSTERQELIEAVAVAHDVTFSTARRNHPDDVRRVRDAVEEAEERKPEITPDEKREVARRTATNIAKSRQIERESREHLRERKSALAVMVEGELTKARYGLIGALNYARDIDRDTFPTEFLDQIQRSLGDIDALVKLVRSAIGGAADIDWDAELEKLEVS